MATEGSSPALQQLIKDDAIGQLRQQKGLEESSNPSFLRTLLDAGTGAALLFADPRWFYRQRG